MIHEKEYVWAIHDSMSKPVYMSRGALNKKRRLGWREYEGTYNGEEKNKEVCEESKDFKETTKEKSNEYNRLVESGVIRNLTRDVE